MPQEEHFADLARVIICKRTSSRHQSRPQCDSLRLACKSGSTDRELYDRCQCQQVIVASQADDHVAQILEEVTKHRSAPTIRVDIGLEFINPLPDWWVYFNQLKLDFSLPGKSIDNALIESFAGSMACSQLAVGQRPKALWSATLSSP